MKNRILGMAAKVAALAATLVDAQHRGQKFEQIPFEMQQLANDQKVIYIRRGKGRGRRPHGRGKYKARLHSASRKRQLAR